jgi:hypothetical protein
MTDVPLWRLYALRAGYLLLVVGLGLVVWPGILHHDKPWSLMGGVVKCMLGAMGALAVIGLRYPLKMLPLLFFEMAWKALWLIVVALPLWRAGAMDADTTEMAFEVSVVAVIVAVVPWGYVAATFLAGPGDRWGRAFPQSQSDLPGGATGIASAP